MILLSAYWFHLVPMHSEEETHLADAGSRDCLICCVTVIFLALGFALPLLRPIPQRRWGPVGHEITKGCTNFARHDEPENAHRVDIRQLKCHEECRKTYVPFDPSCELLCNKKILNPLVTAWGKDHFRFPIHPFPRTRLCSRRWTNGNGERQGLGWWTLTKYQPR